MVWWSAYVLRVLEASPKLLHMMVCLEHFTYISPSLYLAFEGSLAFSHVKLASHLVLSRSVSSLLSHLVSFSSAQEGATTWLRHLMGTHPPSRHSKALLFASSAPGHFSLPGVPLTVSSAFKALLSTFSSLEGTSHAPGELLSLSLSRAPDDALPSLWRSLGASIFKQL